MSQKNTSISILRNFEDIPSFMYKGRFIIAVIFSIVLLLSACSKPSGDNALLQAYFVSNILNKNYIVQYASDSSIDITNQYVQDTFMLKLDTTVSFFSGPLVAVKGTSTFMGTWDSNSDYSKLDINLTIPNAPAEFDFLSRSWRFTKKGVPVMQLAPWGSTAPLVLYMQRL